MKHLIHLLALILVFPINNFFAQFPQWRMLPAAPNSTIKLDDCYFVNHSTGWVICGLTNPRRIYKTTNGGVSWAEQYSDTVTFRSVGFANAMTGWVGTLTSPKVLFQTTNGGVNWSTVTLPNPVPLGICGIHVLDSMNVFACGRYDFYAVFVKSTNRGLSWTTKTLSPLLSSVVDCYFINKDSGFVVGGKGTPIYNESVPVILFTSNGGNNWVTRYTGTLKKEWCWKISMLNRDSAFVAVESYRFTDSIAYLRTNNGGLNWHEHRFEIDTSIYHVEGIGFISPMVGWIGGYLLPESNRGVTDGKTYQTTNGGASWQPVTWGFNINRIRFLSDTSAYAVGRTVYRYTNDSTIGIWGSGENVPKNFILSQNYPNPFNPATKIKYSLKKKSDVSIVIYDVGGKEVYYYSSSQKPAGEYEINWYGVDMQGVEVATGVYLYRVTAEQSTETKKMVLVR